LDIVPCFVDAWALLGNKVEVDQGEEIVAVQSSEEDIDVALDHLGLALVGNNQPVHRVERIPLERAVDEGLVLDHFHLLDFVAASVVVVVLAAAAAAAAAAHSQAIYSSFFSGTLH